MGEENGLIASVESVWSLRLNGHSRPLVKEGDWVKRGQPIVSQETLNEAVIDLAEGLTKKPLLTKDSLEVRVGNKIKEGELLARIKVSPLTFKKILSPVSGRVGSFSPGTGVVKIVVSREERQITSPLSGTVAKVGESRLEIAFKAHQVKGKGIIQGKNWGELAFFFNAKPATLTKKYEGKILVVDRATPFLVQKGVVLGVKGFVALAVDFFAPEDKMIKLPVLVLDGEGRNTVKKLKSLVGQPALVDGSSHQLLISLEK